MKRVFGLVGYACNGKSTIIKKITNNKDYVFIDLPSIYKNEAAKNNYSGVTQWYVGVEKEQYAKESKKAVLNYIDKEMPRDKNLIIDDVFDIDVYNKLISLFPQMKLIAFHSKYNDRLQRLQERTGMTEKEDLIRGLEIRDGMKRYCGIEDIFPHCKYEITNKKDIESAKKLLNSEINKNLIICIVGYSGSGKSTVCKFVSNTLNLPIFHYGKEVTKLVNEEGYKKSRYYIEANGIEAYQKLVDNKLYERIKQFMKSNKVFIIDGMVSDEIFDRLSNKNDIYSIYVKLDKEERIKRLIEREGIEKDRANEELEIKDGIKIECGLDIIVSKCNAITNGDKPQNIVIDEVINLIENNNK